MRSLAFRAGPLALVSLLAACSSELPSTRVVSLKDAVGNDVVGPDGQVVRAKEVQRPDGTWVGCDSDQGARALVKDGAGSLQYVGQGLLNRTCAFGQCHAEGATDALRQGAPEGMNFDLRPAALETDAAAQQLALDVLTIHQRAVHDMRDHLWTQVDRDHMPPTGTGDPFRGSPGLTLVTLDADGGCTEGAPVLPITTPETRWQLGAWLVCGSPVVEVSDASITQSQPGAVGRRVPACGGAEPPTTEGVRFEDVYVMLQTDCLGCHPGASPWDLSTPEIAYQSLLGPASCMGLTAMTVPHDPENSYILHKMADPMRSTPQICGQAMPYGLPYAETRVELVRAWIEAGAPGPGEALGGAAAPAPGASGGPDAGL